MKRRAVSEIVSAIIIIVVVVAGLGIYTGLSQQRILGDVLSVKETIEQQEGQLSEMIEYLDMFIADSDKISIFVHNYGLKNVTISQIFANGTENMSESPRSFYVRDLSQILISPDNQTIPVGKTSEIVLDFGTTIPGTISNVVIKTDSDKFIQFLNNTN